MRPHDATFYLVGASGSAISPPADPLPASTSMHLTYPICPFVQTASTFRIRKGRKERVVTVGRVGLRRSGLDLPFWFRVAVGLAEISAKFRGETVENGLQTTWTPYWTLRRHYTGSPPRARRCVCVRAFASALSQRDRARPHVGACARGVGVRSCVNDEDQGVRTRAPAPISGGSSGLPK